MLFAFAYFLNQIYLRGQVVGIAVEPNAAGVGAQGVALVAALLLEEVVAHENGVLVKFQRAAVLANQVAVHYNLVKEVPLAVVHQRALARFVQRVVPRIVKVAGLLHVFLFGMAAQTERHAFIVRVVVHVAHYYDFGLRFLF